MENRTKLLAALRRVRHFPSYHSFMAEHERQRIKRELQKRLAHLRHQQQARTVFSGERKSFYPSLLRSLFH